MIVNVRLLDLAREVAQQSTCVRRRVGAVLVLQSGDFSHGFNMERDGLRCDQGECPRGTKTYAEQPACAPYLDCVAYHAEVRAVAPLLGLDLHGAVIYISEEPCPGCSVFLRAQGIRWVSPEGIGS